MENKKIKHLAVYAVFAALYVVLTWAFSFMSFQAIQFRIAEVLVLLCFYDRKFFYPLTIGCIVANLFSPFGLMDIVIGTIATMIGLIGVMFSKKLWIASIFPVLSNGIVIGLEICYFNGVFTWASFGLNFATVAFGEFVCVSLFGVFLFKSLEYHPMFIKLIKNVSNNDENSQE